MLAHADHTRSVAEWLAGSERTAMSTPEGNPSAGHPGGQPPPFTVGAVVGPQPLPAAPPRPMPSGAAEPTRLLGELVALTRELVGVSREQLELTRRAEQRFQEQQKAQRDEWQRWTQDYQHLRGRSKPAEEAVRGALAKAITDLVTYI